MRLKRQQLPSLVLLFLLGLFLALGTRSVIQQWKENRLIELQGFEPGQFGSTDWIRWVDTKTGVKATEIHPLISNDPLKQGLYLKEGDILRGIEFEPVYQAAAVENILRSSPPGTYLNYTIEREDPSAFVPVSQTILIRTSYFPWFSYLESASLWSLFPWLTLTGFFLSLIILLILAPFLRENLRKTWPVLLVLASGFLLFGMFSAYHLNLALSNDLYTLSTEKVFSFILVILALLYALSAIYIWLEKISPLLIIGPAIPAILLGIASYKALFLGAFTLYGTVILRSLFAFLLLMVFASLLFSMLSKWKSRSRLDKISHVLSLAFTLPLLIMMFPNPASHSNPAPAEELRFLSLSVVFIPLLNSAASQLKFGKVSLVLTRSIQYLLFGGLSLVLYFLIHKSLAYLELRGRYQPFLEFGLLILVVILFRSLYLRYENRLGRYFVLSGGRKGETMEAFISRIPRYTTTEELLRDLVLELKDYFNAGATLVWVKQEAASQPPENFSEEDLEELYQELSAGQAFWAQNKGLNARSLPFRLERRMVESPYTLVYSFSVKDNIYGLLFLGSKRRGVYNLADLELLNRVVQPARLSLGVLHLLEREKLLLQKNYEANLTALRSQINPHFLFNTLNTISALIHDAPDDAEEAVEKLAFIFRYTLKHSDRAFVKLKEELSLIRTYLDIEKLRFGARLTVHYEIEREMEDVELPALVLQTIVENCIKHGIAKIIDPGVIRIAARPEAENMILEIEDNGPGIDLSRIHSSTGLNNIITRFEQIYQIKNLLYFENTGQGTLVKIKIPLIHEQIQSADRGR